MTAAAPERSTLPQALHPLLLPLLSLASAPVIHVVPTTSLMETVRVMARHRISFVPVLDAEARPQGMVTETRVLELLHHQTAVDTPVAGLMTPAVTIGAHAHVEQAWQRCQATGSRHLVITNSDGRAVAVFSETDFRIRLNLGMLAGRYGVTAVMSPIVHTLGPTHRLEDAMALMADAPEALLLVTEGEQALGLITARDVTRLHALDPQAGQRLLSEVMSTPVHTIGMDTTLNLAATQMLEWKVRELVVVDDHGRLAGLLTQHDLTRTLTLGLLDGALSQDRALHRAMLDAIPDLVWLKDPDGIYLSCNRRFEAFYGHPEGHIVGRSDHDFVSAELAEFFREHDRRAVECGRASVNEEMLTFASDQHTELVQTIKTPMRDAQGRLLGVLGVARDITALRRAEEDQRALFAYNPVPMVIYRLDGLALLQVNEAFRALYGYSDGEARGLNLTDLYLPSERARVVQRVTELQGLVYVGEWQHLRKDGTVIDVEARSHDLLHQGEACRLVVFTDITRHKRSQRRDRSRLALMESLTRNEPLPDLLARLVHDHESMFTDSLCAIILADDGGQRMTVGAAPSLPGFYNAALEGMPVAPGVGSCGTAIATGRRIISRDLSQDPAWTPYQALVRAARLGACWSEPVFGSQGEVLGSFAVYRRSPAEPSEEELDHVSFSVQLAAMAIQHSHTSQRLRNSERRLRDILHAIPDLVWLQDPQDRYIDCNAAFEQLTGLPRGLLLGANDAGLPELPGPSNPELLGSGQTATCEAWLHDQAARQRTLYEVIRTPLYDERRQAIGVLGVARDITLIKQGAQAIAEQERLVDTMFSQTTDAIVLIDPQTQGFVTFNDAACDGLGYSREAFARLRPQDVQADFDPAQIGALIQRALGGEAINIETRHLRADGSLQQATLTLRSLSYAGRPLISAVWRDITVTKQHEARIRRLNQAYAVLGSINEAIVRIRDTDALFAEVCRIAVEVGGFRMAWIGGPDGSGQVRPRLHAGYSNGYAEALAVPVRDGGSGPLERMLASGQPSVVPDIAADPILAPWHAAAASRGYRSLAIFPILQDGPRWHCLAVYSDALDPVDEEQLTLYTRAARDLGFALDFTAAEQERRHEQQLRETLMESVAGLFFAINTTGRLVLWNRQLEFVTGCDHAEVERRVALDFFEGEDRDRIARSIARVFAEGDGSEQAVIVSRDGSRRPYLFVLRRLDLSDGPLLVGTGIDISARVRAEEELQRYQQHLEELVAQRTTELEVANARLNREDTRLRAMLTLSQRASTLDESELCQRGIDEMVRLTDSAAGCLHTFQGDGPQPALLVRSLAGGTGTCTVASPEPPAETDPPLWQQVLRQQRTVILEADTPDAAPAGRRIGVPVVEDEQVRLILCASGKPTPYTDNDARELQLFGGDLWRILRRRRIELALERAKAEADAANQAKSAFLANMSHEIRTPMNAIIGFAHLLRRDPLTPRQQDHLRKITDASQHLSQVIDDVLDFSKIEARKVHLDASDFDLADSLARVADMVRERARAKGLQLRLPAAGNLRLRGDRLRLEQVLLNLLGNAVKFTHQGSVSLGVQMQAGTADGLRLRFEVTDTGIGIAPEQLPHLFQAFEQGDVSTTRRFGGTGLGLAISKRLTELMGGEIGVRSEAGHGSTFWLELPFETADDAPRPHRVEATVSPSPRPSARVLLVEDNPINQEVALTLLADLGVQVTLADDGLQALAAWSRQPYDLVLMDVQMPVLDGLSATRQLRQRPDGAEVPIIAMTANAFEDDRQRCLSAGMTDYLAKPVDPQALRRCLAHWLAPAEPAQAAPPPETTRPDAPTAPTAPPAAAPGQTAAPRLAEPNSLPLHKIQQVPGLDWAGALARTRHQWPLYLRALQLFVEHHGHDGDRLTEAALQGDNSRLRQLAHALGGAAAAVGATDVQQQARSLETTARTQENDHQPPVSLHQVLPLVDQLETVIDRLRTALQANPAPVSAGQAPLAIAQAQQALRALEPLLASHDTAVCELFEQQRTGLAPALGPAVEALGEAIDGFQFDVALQLVRQLLATPAN